MCESSEALENFRFNRNQQFRAALNSGEREHIPNTPNVRSIMFALRFEGDMHMPIERVRLLPSWMARRRKGWELRAALCHWTGWRVPRYAALSASQQCQGGISCNSGRVQVWCRVILRKIHTHRSRNFNLESSSLANASTIFVTPTPNQREW